MNIRDSINSQVRINKDKILETNSELIKSELIMDFTPVIISSPANNNEVSFIDVSTSIEVKVPSIMLSVMHNINIDEYISNNSNKESLSRYESLMTILYSISSGIKLARSYTMDTRRKFWVSTGIKLLELINKSNLLSDEFRKDIYSNLNVVSGYIKYSDINEYEFY